MEARWCKHTITRFRGRLRWSLALTQASWIGDKGLALPPEVPSRESASHPLLPPCPCPAATPSFRHSFVTSKEAYPVPGSRPSSRQLHLRGCAGFQGTLERTRHEAGPRRTRQEPCRRPRKRFPTSWSSQGPSQAVESWPGGRPWPGSQPPTPQLCDLAKILCLSVPFCKMRGLNKVNGLFSSRCLFSKCLVNVYLAVESSSSREI